MKRQPYQSGFAYQAFLLIMLSPAIISLPFIIFSPVAIFAAYIMLTIPNLLITFCIGISKDLFRLQRGETGSIIPCIIGTCCGGVLSGLFAAMTGIILSGDGMIWIIVLACYGAIFAFVLSRYLPEDNDGWAE